MFERLIRNPKMKRKIIIPCNTAINKNQYDDCYYGNRWIVVPIIHCSSRKGSFIVIDTLTNEEFDVDYCKGVKSKQKRWIVTRR